MTDEFEQKIKNLMGGDEYEGLAQLVKLGRKASPYLVKMLEGSDPLMRKRAAIALGRIRDATTLEPLVHRLSDIDPTVVISVLDALALMNVEEVSENIVPLLKNRDPSVRFHAVRALGELKSEKSVSSLIEMVDKEKQGFILKEASEALKKIENLNNIQDRLRMKNMKK